MLLAPPMVSQASIFLTKFWSCNIFFTENASESVTDSGSPSGIATTMTVIPKIKYLRRVSKSVPVSHSLVMPLTMANLMRSTIMIITAEIKPNFPISSANFSSFP